MADSEPTLLVIDVANVALRAIFGMPELLNTGGEPIQGGYGAGATILNLCRQYQPTHVVAARDPSRADLRRRTLSPAYKAHRPDADPDIVRQMQLAHRVIDALGIPWIGADAAEADDVAASLARQFPGQVVIASADKDLLSTVTTCGRVKVHVFGRDVLADWDTVEQIIGVPPDKVTDYKALIGDSSDGYPGVPGIGPKMAQQLLAAYGTAEEVFAHADEVEGRAGTALRKGLDEGRLSLQLARLDDALDLDLPDAWQPDIEAAQTALAALEMPSLARDLGALHGVRYALAADDLLW